MCIAAVGGASAEEHPILHLYRHEDKPYHIDYCFASKALMNCLHTVEIGEYAVWKQHSDHVPVSVEFLVS